MAKAKATLSKSIRPRTEGEDREKVIEETTAEFEKRFG